MVLAVLVALGGLGAGLAWVLRPGTPAPAAASRSKAAAASASASASGAQLEPGAPATTTRMAVLTRITGDIRPKSVVASGHGQVIANNMIYQHSSTLYDAGTMKLSATIPDTVDLATYGKADRKGTTHGAPVEAAWTRDGKYAYVSQYSLTGPGSGAPGTDACRGGESIGRSALFRYSVATGGWDQVIEVGRVPKYVALTPDGTRALVSNWCDKTISVVDLKQARQVATIPVDSAPRGIVILPDNRTAYATAMYADELYRLDLEKNTSEKIMKTGRKPRHLVLSHDARSLFLTEAGADRLVQIDATTGKVMRTVRTGREPRSMDISTDGTALYIVNYYENTLSKFDTRTLTEVQRIDVGVHPVGVTYEPTHRRVWVANYHGSIDVVDDTVAVDKAKGNRESPSPGSKASPSPASTSSSGKH